MSCVDLLFEIFRFLTFLRNVIIVLSSQKKMLERKIAALQHDGRDSDSDEEMRETGVKKLYGKIKNLTLIA